jgi:hypothetical protein
MRLKMQVPVMSTSLFAMADVHAFNAGAAVNG